LLVVEWMVAAGLGDAVSCRFYCRMTSSLKRHSPAMQKCNVQIVNADWNVQIV